MHVLITHATRGNCHVGPPASYLVAELLHSSDKKNLLLAPNVEGGGKSLCLKPSIRGFGRGDAWAVVPRLVQHFTLRQSGTTAGTGWLYQLFVDQMHRSGCSKMRFTTKPWMNGKSQSHSQFSANWWWEWEDTTVVKISLPLYREADKEAYKITSLAMICW